MNIKTNLVLAVAWLLTAISAQGAFLRPESVKDHLSESNVVVYVECPLKEYSHVTSTLEKLSKKYPDINVYVYDISAGSQLGMPLGGLWYNYSPVFWEGGHYSRVDPTEKYLKSMFAGIDNLMKEFESHGNASQVKKSRKLLTKVLEGECPFPEALNCMAWTYMHDPKKWEDPSIMKQAYDWFVEGAMAGDPECMFQCGYFWENNMHHFGYDVARAYDFYRRGARLGDERCIRKVTELEEKERQGQVNLTWP